MSEMQSGSLDSINETATNQKPNKPAVKKSLFRSAARLYIALAILALVGTLGWFTVNTLVFIENETAGNIQISVSSGDLWIAQSLDDFTDLGYNDKGRLIEINREETSTYIDVSGDGEYLYYPKGLSIDDTNHDVADLSSANNFADVSGNESFYVELRVYFRTTSAMNVYLSKDSAVKSKEQYIVNSGSVNAFSRTSLYGNFSCDGIIGAARVAFLESDMAEEETLTLKNVWIPNDDIRLYYTDEESGRNTAVLQTNVSGNLLESKESGYHYLAKNGNVMEEKTYTAEDYAQGVATVTGGSSAETILANPNTKMVNQATPLLTFDDPGHEQTKLLVIRIWFEGTDREADKALNGGMASYNLSFYGESKAEPEYDLIDNDMMTNLMTNADYPVPSGKVGIYYNENRGALAFFTRDDYNQAGAHLVDNNYLLYSFDGITWSAYTSTTAESVLNPKRSSTPYTIFIRTAETKSQFPGNVVSVTIPAI